MKDTPLSEDTARDLTTQLNGLSALITQLLQKQDRDIADYLTDLTAKIQELAEAVSKLSQTINATDISKELTMLGDQQRETLNLVQEMATELKTMTQAMGSIDFEE